MVFLYKAENMVYQHDGVWPCRGDRAVGVDVDESVDMDVVLMS